MANPVKALGRALLGTVFIGGGYNQLKDPAYPIMLTDGAKQTYGLTDLPDSKVLVQANGIGMLAAGTTMSLGIMPRRSALLLAALLLPTNVVGHAFWTKDDPQAAFIDRNEFLANMAIIGGLLFVALDKRETEQKPD